MSREKCDACRSTACPDKHLCDVVLPTFPCPEGRDPAKARQEANAIAFEIPRYSVSRKGAGGGANNRRWTEEQISLVHALRNQGETWEAAGLRAGLDTDPKRAKNAAVGIVRRHPRPTVVAS